jgi:carbon storage regulator CsrA
MLVLTRFPEEGVKIICDGEVVCTVMVLKVIGDAVKLGFQADESVRILRSELKDFGKKNKKNVSGEGV